MPQINYFEKLFYPKSIAYIGASSKRAWQLIGLVDRGFSGDLYFISKGSDEIHGIKCFKDLTDIPDGIDHAIIAVNRNNLLEIVKICIEKKFSTVHIFSAGTGEFDEEGRKIEDELFTILKKSDTRAIGPNCMGLYSTRGRFTFNPSFKTEPGNIAFISQSGDLTERFVNNLNYYGVNFSYAASIGNSISINATDLIQYFDADDNTEIIACYFEGFSKYHHNEGKRLFKTLKNVKKPVIFLRSGKTEAGKRSAESHTGSLVGSNDIWNAVLTQTNTISVRTFEELMDTTMAFNYSKHLIPKNRGILLISWSGGNATIATDLITQLGAEVPEFSAPTKEKLKKMIRFGGVVNPLDLPWKNFSDEYSNISKIAIKEPYISCVIAESYRPTGDNTVMENYYSNLIFLKDLCQKLEKSFFVSLPFTNYLGGTRETYKRKIIELGVPIFPSLERAAKAFLNLYNFQKRRNQK